MSPVSPVIGFCLRIRGVFLKFRVIGWCASISSEDYFLLLELPTLGTAPSEFLLENGLFGKG